MKFINILKKSVGFGNRCFFDIGNLKCLMILMFMFIDLALIIFEVDRRG